MDSTWSSGESDLPAFFYNDYISCCMFVAMF